MKKRGMVKWQPFASLPEQAGYIESLLYDLEKVEKPKLSEEALEALNYQILEYHNAKTWVRMTYFYDGYAYLVEGVITKIEPVSQTIVLKNQERENRFGFSSILSIEQV